MTKVLVQCDGARIPPQVAREYKDAPRLTLNLLGGRSTNVTLRLKEYSDPLNGSLRGECLDLVRTAAYVYAADQLVSRGGDTDIYGGSWRREFMFCLPVSDPAFWDQQAIHDQQVLGFASEDHWSFCFDESRLPEQLPLRMDERGIRHNPDCVVLYSGGVDSLCAAIETNMLDGAKPVLISHHPSGVFDHRQQNLVKELRRYVSNWSFPHTRFQVNRIKSRERDTTQRTRSFLFAALGAASASTLGLSKVVLADNGIVSLNLPINDQEIGAIASRSTHPKFIGFFNKLAATVLPCQPQVCNPLWARTKAEALDVLRSAKAEPLLQETNSCAHRSRLPVVTPHCGVCSQCIERRFASTAAGMEEYDLAERYREDIFRGSLQGNGLTMAESYVRFARKADGMPVEGLFLEYPQLNDCILSEDPTPAMTAEALGNLVLRNAATVMAVMAGELAKAAHEGSKPCPSLDVPNSAVCGTGSD
jgi:7-cyano-7-deazaguanine synthase in queuosine biosynthesis